MTLKHFSRGKPKLTVGSYEKAHGKRVLLDTKAKKRKKKTTEYNSVTENSNLVANTAERLSYAALREGLIVLGRICEVTEYELLVSLPGGVRGQVQLTDLSESYTSLLTNIVEHQIRSNEFKSLPELYSIGEYVVCYVKSIDSERKWSVQLSLEPQLINQNVDVTYLKKTSKVVCTISSIEDHGYVIETGIASVRAFIDTKDVEDSSKCFPGKQLLCSIKEIKIGDSEFSVVKLSAKEKHVQKVTDDIESLDALMPGTRCLLTVTNVLSNGLQVSYGKNSIGYVNQIYLDEHLSDYEKDMELTGTLLYIMLSVKFAYFSLLPNNTKRKRLNVGHIAEKATVLFKESNNVVFRLTDRTRGIVSLRNSNEDEIAKFNRGSTHRCRVMSYNWIEEIHVCTTQRDLLDEKYFSLSDVTPGDVTTVKIVNVNNESQSVAVELGKLKGIVPSEHLSDTGLSALNDLKLNECVKARVLSIDHEYKRVKFTLKQSLLDSKLPVLHDIRQAKYGAQYHGTVVQINQNGMLVKFYGDVKGWLPNTFLNKFVKFKNSKNWNYSIGQTIAVKVKSVNETEGKMILDVADESFKERERKVLFSVGETVEGTVVESTVEGVTLTICKNENIKTTGFIPAGHMAPCFEIASLLASKCVPGDLLSALVFSTTPTLILTRTFLSQEQYRTFNSLKIGDCIPCSVTNINQNGLRVLLPLEDYTKFGFVPHDSISNLDLLRISQILFAKITLVNKKKKLLGLSTSLKNVWNDNDSSGMIPAVDLLHLYFNKLSELIGNPFYKNRPISSARLGQKVSGVVRKISDHGLVLQLENNLTGVVNKNHYTDIPSIGDKVNGTVLWIDYVHEFVNVTLVPTISNRISSKQSKLPNLPLETVLRGTIVMVTNWFILITVKHNEQGVLAALPARKHVNDILPDLSPYVVGNKIRCYVVLNKNESDILPICVLQSVFETPKVDETPKILPQEKRITASSEDKQSVEKVKIEKKRKGDKEKKNLNENKVTRPDVEDEAPIKRKSQETSKVRKRKIKSNSLERHNEQTKPESDRRTLHVPECGFDWDGKAGEKLPADEESSSDDTEEEIDEPKRKKKKLSAAERIELERQKERAIREREEALASNQTPNSVDQFDRMVLASPNSSLVWLQYMVFHLQATEIEKARAVARRAIKTINFREENEKLNVWNAWLNLESKFGTPETLNDVLQEAVRTNDSLKIYTHMLTVHAEAGRQIELEKIINTITKKFKENFQVWVDCGTALMKIGLKEKSRHIMQRALQSLPLSDHVNLMVRFAKLENNYGDKERSQTLFEQILSSYPKRVDVWSSYVDCLVKTGDIDIARKVLERATVQILPARKMKTLFKKFLSFEEKHGTAEGVARVQQMAVEYVNKQCSKESS